MTYNGVTSRLETARAVSCALNHTRSRALVMSGGDAVTTDTRIDPATTEQVVAVDDMLRLVAAVTAERHRDPMKALADRLLDLRLAVRG